MDSVFVSRLVALGRRPWRFDPATAEVRIIDADGRPVMILPAGGMKAEAAGAAILDVVNASRKLHSVGSFDPSI